MSKTINMQARGFNTLEEAERFAVFESYKNQDFFFYLFFNTSGKYVVDFDPTNYSDEKRISTYYKAEKQ